MAYSASADMPTDPAPELTAQEQDIVDCLLESFTKLSDPEEIIFDMTGISSHWNKLGKAIRNMRRQDESSMDSIVNRFGLDSTTNATTVLPSLINKILKMEHDSGNPPSLTREALRN
ncbi:unnamed protein product [Lactuca virosa]|uniref:Uncharacterized protein n=1 Tax=Lactuca virosa TaxID=75947 RepID=A0AAU9MJ38_9ASTR|nr:unnamed protein product [Lactuca virosa]